MGWPQSFVRSFCFWSQKTLKRKFFYINSLGGAITSALAIYDTMEYVHPDVATLCIGQAASAGSILLCAGAKKKRHALPNSRVMIHQPLGGVQGQASDIAIHAKEILATRDRLNRIYQQRTVKTLEEIEKAMERDRFHCEGRFLKKNLIFCSFPWLPTFLEFLSRHKG